MQRHVLSVLSLFTVIGLTPLNAAPAHVPHGKMREKHHLHSPSHHHMQQQGHGKMRTHSPQAALLTAPRTIIPAAVAAPALLLPLNPVFPAPRQVITLAPEVVHPHQPIVQSERRYAPEPSSFVPTDPRAVISELPSGRIFMGAPVGVFPARQRHGHQRLRENGIHPYAPPSIQIIGDLPRRKMGKPVRLTHGTDVSRRFNTGPKVIWLKADNMQETSPHVRHIK